MKRITSYIKTLSMTFFISFFYNFCNALVLESITIAGSAVSIARDVYNFGCYLCPSDEQKLEEERKDLELKKRREIIESEKKLHDCWVNKIDAEKGTDGTPLACKDFAKRYEMSAGYVALNREKALYREAIKEK